jgi:hypothetical protein
MGLHQGLGCGSVALKKKRKNTSKPSIWGHLLSQYIVNIQGTDLQGRTFQRWGVTDKLGDI